MLAVTTFELVLRMVLSLGFVAVLGWAVTRAARGHGGGLGGLGGLGGIGGRRSELRVCARQPLSRSATVAVLQAGERHFLVGVTDAGVTLLAEGDDLVTPDDEPDDGRRRRHRGPWPPGGGDAGAAGDPLDDIVDVRAAEPPSPADGGAEKRVAGRRHGRAAGPAPAGMGVIEALRERTIRRR